MQITFLDNREILFCSNRHRSAPIGSFLIDFLNTDFTECEYYRNFTEKWNLSCVVTPEQDSEYTIKDLYDLKKDTEGLVQIFDLEKKINLDELYAYFWGAHRDDYLDEQRNCRDFINLCFDKAYVDLSPSQKFFLYQLQTSSDSTIVLDNSAHFMKQVLPTSNFQEIKEMKRNIKQYSTNEIASIVRETPCKWANIYSTISDIIPLCSISCIELLFRDTKIGRCKRCDAYFLINGRSDTCYCELCKKSGPMEKYLSKIMDDDLLRLRYKEYQRRYARIRHLSEPKKGQELAKIKEWSEKSKKKISENPTAEEFDLWIKESREDER